MAKPVLFFYFEACPYCRAAWNWVEELISDHPEFESIAIERIDEKKDPARADQYDYWSVPTFYVDGKKVHEGAATKEIVEQVLRSALMP